MLTVNPGRSWLRQYVRRGTAGGGRGPSGRLSRPARLLLFLLLVVSGPVGLTAAASAQQRVALVIANSSYAALPRLPNPVNDGRLIAGALKEAGFESVTVVENQDRAATLSALLSFRKRADRAEVALVYYAGHGVESAGQNYLLPVDAKVASERDLALEAVTLETMQTAVGGASRLRIIILDACRTPPPTIQRNISTRGLGRGLAAIEPAAETLVVFSAKAGTAAQDGAGANSPFAAALARNIVQPGREISLLFRHVRDDVLSATGRQQEPFTYGSLSSEEFYFISPVAVASAAVPGRDSEKDAWELCRAASTDGQCNSYLRLYPAGRFASLARLKVEDLRSQAATAKAAAQPAVLEEAVAMLGMRVRGSSEGIVVDSVDRNGAALGQLFAGDVILSINSAQPTRGLSPANQLTSVLGTGMPVKLLVRRGPSKTVVVLRMR